MKDLGKWVLKESYHIGLSKLEASLLSLRGRFFSYKRLSVAGFHRAWHSDVHALSTGMFSLGVHKLRRFVPLRIFAVTILEGWYHQLLKIRTVK